MALRKKKSLLDQASDYVDTVRPQVESAVTSALDAVEDFYENTARPALVDAKEKAGPTLADARTKAAPYVADARDRAAAALADAKEVAGPALAVSAAKAGEVAAQAKESADARVAQLRGEEKKKGSKLKKLAIFAALAGAIGFVAKKLQSGGQADNWQSSYVPTPAPAPRRPTTPAPQARTRRSPTRPTSRTRRAPRTSRPRSWTSRPPVEDAPKKQ